VPLAIDARSQAFEDAEGEFIRNAGCATKTASGSVYLITSGGKRLCQGNLIPDGQSFQKSLEKALKAWQELPAAERKPGAASIGEHGAADPKRVAQTPPADSLVLRVFSRQFGRDAKGELRFTVADDYVPEIRKHAARFRESANDYMWITAKEWQALVPANPTTGSRVPVPPALAERLARWHLDPATGLGEGRNFSDANTGIAQVSLVVVDVSADTIKLRLEGTAKLDNSRRTLPVSFEPALLGYLTFDRGKKAFTRFDVLALGDVRGSPAGENRMGERTGAQPLGIVFELAGESGPLPAPRGARDNAERYLSPKLKAGP
jgi:hypothetical protein